MDPTGQGETLRVVCPWDPAIAWPDERRAQEKQASAYHRERDFAALRFTEGTRPRVFVTRRLRRSEMRDVSCMSSEPYQHEAGFVMGVSRVEMPDGSTLRPANGSRWTEDELDAHFDHAAINDIGSVVVQRSRIPLGLPASFVEPHSSVAALVAFLSQSAERSRRDADPSKRPLEGASDSPPSTTRPSAQSGE